MTSCAGANADRVGAHSSISDHAQRTGMEEAAIEDASAAIAESKLASALPDMFPTEPQICGLGYIEEAVELNLEEQLHGTQDLASASLAEDNSSSARDRQTLPEEDGAVTPDRLSKLLNSMPEATEPVTNRMEALTVIEDRRPSTGKHLDIWTISFQT